jgi:DNA polymerase-3 subunit delta
LPTNITYLYGIEKYLIDKEIKDTKANIQMPEMNIRTFSEMDEEAVILACEQIPFCSEYNLVIVEDKFKSTYDILADYIKKGIPDSTLLFLVATDKMDGRSKLYKAIKKFGTIIEYKKLKANGLNKFIQDETTRRKATIDKKAMDLLINRTSYLSNDNICLYDVLSSLDKLTNYSKQITDEVVEKIVEKSPEENVFKLTELIVQKRIQEAMKYMKGLLELGNAPLYLISLITRHFRILLKLNIVQNPSTLGLHPFVKGQMTRQMKFFEENTLFYIVTECVNTQKQIKTGKLKGELALENLVSNINILINK